MTERRYYGLTYALIGAALFSLKPILIKLAYVSNIDPVTLLTLRMMMALPFYLIIGLREILTTKVSFPDIKPHLFPSMLIGVLGYYLASYLDLTGLTMITAQLERLILFTYPTLVVIFSAVLFKQPIEKRLWLALLFTYAGITCIVGNDMTGLGDQVIAGSGLVFCSAVCFALFIVLSKARIASMGSRLFTSIAMSAAAVVVMLQFVVSRPFQDLFVASDVLLLIFGIAVVSTVLPSFLVNAAIHEIGPQQTSLIGSVGPMLTASLAVSVLGEVFTIYHALGMILVVVGVTIVTVEPSSRRKKLSSS